MLYQHFGGFPLDINLGWHSKTYLGCHPKVQIQKGVFVIFLQPLFTSLMMAPQQWHQLATFWPCMEAIKPYHQAPPLRPI